METDGLGLFTSFLGVGLVCAGDLVIGHLSGLYVKVVTVFMIYCMLALVYAEFQIYPISMCDVIFILFLSDNIQVITPPPFSTSASASPLSSSSETNNPSHSSSSSLSKTSESTTGLMASQSTETFFEC